MIFLKHKMKEIENLELLFLSIEDYPELKEVMQMAYSSMESSYWKKHHIESSRKNASICESSAAGKFDNFGKILAKKAKTLAKKPNFWRKKSKRWRKKPNFWQKKPEFWRKKPKF